MSIREWFSERLPIDGDALREMTNEPVPNHMKRWWFALGGTPAYLFIVQIVTGILLALYYQGSAETAYESVRRITEEVSFGWYIRSVHKWAATLMVASMVLHQMRVFFTGAYRKPRELNWMVGCSLLIVVLLTGFTGYSLVYEQLSFWGATVGANIANNIPYVGDGLKRLLLGGSSYGPATLPRFYVLHAALLPASIVVLVFCHIAIIRLQGVSELRFAADEKSETKHFKFIPDHLYTELIVGLVLMVLLSTLAILFPADLGPKANPLVTPEVIKPEWFFYVAFRWLKLMGSAAALLSMGFIVFAMFLWPFIDAQIRKRTRYPEASVYIGALAALAIMALTIWEAVVEH